MPWVYLGSAFISFALFGWQKQGLEFLRKRQWLSLNLFIGALITLGFWAWTQGGSASLYAFYIWTTLLITLATGHFFVLLGDRFHVGQAKRVYGLIGAGGLIGATTGSITSAALLQWMDTRSLLLAASLGLVITGIFPLFLSSTQQSPLTKSFPEKNSPMGTWQVFVQQPYLRTLLFIVFLGTVTVTFVDLTFKTVLAEKVSPEKLGTTFAGLYAVLNATALIVQLTLAPFLIRRLGVYRAVGVLPCLLLGGSVLFVATLSVIPIMLLKSFDGALRHSLYRTATELLYVPLRPFLRSRAKVLIDSIGGRGGQGIASLAALFMLSSGGGTLEMGLVLLGLCSLWLFTLHQIRTPYLNLFRDYLKRVEIEETSSPDLDLASLETLISTLNSNDPSKVIQSLNIFQEGGKAHLIPALILYHPSRPVVLRALEIFNTSERRDHLNITSQLLEHKDPHLQAAAIRSFTVKDQDLNPSFLRRALQNPSTPVSANALVALVARGVVTDPVEIEQIAAEISERSMWCRVELVRSIKYFSPHPFLFTLHSLLKRQEPWVGKEIASLAASHPDPKYIPLLLPLLAQRIPRPEARKALSAIGKPAFDYLVWALASVPLRQEIRRHIPRTISRFKNQAATNALLAQLEKENDEVVSYKILRGLGRMVEDPEIVPDKKQLDLILRKNIAESFRLLQWRIKLQDSKLARMAPATHELLVNLLRQKETNYIERCFRILGLKYPLDGFYEIYRGLKGSDERAYSSSQELIEHLLSDPVRQAILVLCQECSRSRLTLSIPPEFRVNLDREFALYSQMMNFESDSLRVITAHFISEIGDPDLNALLDEQQRRATGAAKVGIQEAIDLVRERAAHAS